MARRLRREEIDIPSSVAGKVIGKGGANIKAMHNSPGILSVRVNPSPSSSSQSRVVVLGYSEEAVGDIASRIRNLAVAHPSPSPFSAGTYMPDFYVSLVSYKTGVHVVIKRDESTTGRYKASLKEFTGQELPQVASNIEMLRGQNPESPSANFRFFLPSYHYVSAGKETSLGESHGSGGDDVVPPLSDNGNRFHTAVYDEEGNGRRAYEVRLRKSLSGLSCQLTPSFTIRFGKSVYAEKPSLVSVPFKPDSCYRMEELCKVLRMKLRGMFSSGCGEGPVDRLRKVLLEEGSYEKLGTKQKIDVHVADEEKREGYKLSMRPSADKDSSSVAAAAEITRILKSTDYFQVLDIPVNSPTTTIKKAYYRIMLLVHPDKNRELDADIVTKAVNQAYATLKNESKRLSHIRSLPCHVPICIALSEEERKKMKPRPEVISFRNKKRRLGFVGLTGGWQDVDFRMRVQGKSASDAAQDREMLQWVDEAWSQRTSSNILVFGSGKKFKISTVRYKESETFNSDNFFLKISKLTSTDAQNTSDPPKVEVSLRSWKIKELISSTDQQWRSFITDDNHPHSLLENCIHDLIEEASRLCLAMGSII